MTIIRRCHNHNYTVIPNAIFNDERLAPDVLGILTYLLSRPNNWTVIPNQLCDRFDCGLDRMRRILATLVETGYIVRRKLRDPITKSFSHMEYFVYDDPQRGAVEPAPDNPVVAPEKPDGEKPDVANTVLLISNDSLPITERNISQSAKLNLNDHDWDEFWKACPRKTGKDAAKRVFQKIIKTKRAPAEQLIVGMKRYAAARAGQDQTYTKHPSTWLNAGCWEDEPDAARGGKKDFHSTDIREYLL